MDDDIYIYVYRARYLDNSLKVFSFFFSFFVALVRANKDAIK